MHSRNYNGRYIYLPVNLPSYFTANDTNININNEVIFTNEKICAQHSINCPHANVHQNVHCMHTFIGIFFPDFCCYSCIKKKKTSPE